MREDIDIRLLDYYIHGLAKQGKSTDVSDKQEKTESGSSRAEEKHSPESDDKH